MGSQYPREPTPLAPNLCDQYSPLSRTFLAWLTRPAIAHERDLVRALLRNITAMPGEDRHASLRTLTALCRALPELNAVRIGHWSVPGKDPSHEEEAILVPGLLFQPGQSGLLGVVLDAVRALPVVLEWKGMEQRRRLHFKDSAQAA